MVLRGRGAFRDDADDDADWAEDGVAERGRGREEEEVDEVVGC